MPGRKRVPTALKILRGNPGQRKLNKKEPKPVVGVPEFPSWLEHSPDPVIRQAWDQLAPMLARIQVLTESDLEALSQLVDSIAIYRQARAVLTQHGLTYITATVDGSEMIRPRPEVAIVFGIGRQIRSYLTDFGLTPASRSKIQVTGPGEEDPVEAFLRNGT